MESLLAGFTIQSCKTRVGYLVLNHLCSFCEVQRGQCFAKAPEISTWQEKYSKIESSTVGENYHLPSQWIAPACKCINSPWTGSQAAKGGGGGRVGLVVLRSCLRLGGCCVEFHYRGVLGGILSQLPVCNVVMANEKRDISKTFP